MVKIISNKIDAVPGIEIYSYISLSFWDVKFLNIALHIYSTLEVIIPQYYTQYAWLA